MSEEKRPRVLRDARHVNYDNIAAAAANDIVSAANIVEDTAHTVAAQPDVPRNLSLTVVDTTPSIVAGYIEIVGLNQNGELVEEDVDISDGAGTYYTVNAFSHVSSVTPRDMSVLGGSGDETLAVGSSTKIGVPFPVNGILVDFFKACIDGADEAIGTVSRTYGTIIPTTAPNGTRDYDFWYNTEYEV